MNIKYLKIFSILFILVCTVLLLQNFKTKAGHINQNNSSVNQYTEHPSKENQNTRTISPNEIITQPLNITDKGFYIINIDGHNLEQFEPEIVSDCDNKAIDYLFIKKYNNKIIILFNIKKVSKYTLKLNNLNPKNAEIYNIKVLPVNEVSLGTEFVAKDKIKKIYSLKTQDKYTDTELAKFIIKNKLKIINVKNMPDFVINKYLQEKNSLFLFPKNQGCDSFINSCSYLYETDDEIICSKTFLNEYFNLHLIRKNFIEELDSFFYIFENNINLKNGYDMYGHRYIEPQSMSFGPNIKLQKGAYKLDITGENLNNANITIIYNPGNRYIFCSASEENTDLHRVFYFNADKNLENVEVVIMNNKDKDIMLSHLDIRQILTVWIPSYLHMPVIIKNIYLEDNLLNNQMKTFVIKNKVKVTDISDVPDWLKFLFINRKNSLTLISDDKAKKYLSRNFYLYKFDYQYYVSKNRIDGLNPENEILKNEL